MKKYKLSKKVIERLEDIITMDFLSLEDNVKIKEDINLTEKYIKFCFNTNSIPDKVYNLENLYSEKLGYYFPRFFALEKITEHVNRKFGTEMKADDNILDEYVKDGCSVDEYFIKTLLITFLKLFNKITSYIDLTSMCHVFLDNMDVILIKDFKLVNASHTFNTRYCKEDGGTIGVYLEALDKDCNINFSNMCEHMVGYKENLLHLVSYLYGVKDDNTYCNKEDKVVIAFKEIIIDAFSTINTILINKENTSLEICENCKELFFKVIILENKSCICAECLEVTIK